MNIQGLTPRDQTMDAFDYNCEAELFTNAEESLDRESIRTRLRDLWPTMADWIAVRVTLFRATVVGFLIGTLPGAGATVASFMAYAIDVTPPVRAYMQAVSALPAWAEWRRAALKETWVIPKFEYDWPEVKRLPADAA